MPSIASRIVPHPEPRDRGVDPIRLPSKPSIPIWGNQPPPIVSPILRTPLPANSVTAVPDSLRQYQSGGIIPQYRNNPPAPINANQSAPLATTKTPGTVVPDGKTIKVVNGVLSVIS